MSVDSPLPPSEEPPADSSALPPDEGENEQDWMPKVKRRHRKNESEPESGEASDREILALCSLLLTNLLDKRGTAAAETPPAEARAKVNRFPGKTGIPAAPGALTTDLPAVAAAAYQSTGPMMKLRPRTAEGASREGQWHAGTRWEKGMFYVMVLLVVGAFVYFVGRRVIHSAAVVRSAGNSQVVAPLAKLTTIWSPALISQLDAMLTADQHGDLRTARQLALELRTRMPDSPDLDMYVASLQVRNGDYNKAEESIARLLNGFTPPLLAAAVNENLGFNYARKRNLPLAISSFADAVAADPFNPVHFYHWGEALRRKGQLQEAIDHLSEALTRLPPGLPGTESQRDEVEFKMNLTRIELGKDDDAMKAAIADHLKTPTPTGYWLLTAAAYNLQHGDMALAADNLQKARATLPPDIYAALTNDYFLHGFADHDEVSALLNAGPAAARAQVLQPRMGYFIDP